MVFRPEAAANWFLTWDEDAADAGKSFLLQVKIAALSFRDLLSDGINSYATICRQRNGPDSAWELLGKTAIIKDDPNPEYPEGFRVFYEQDSNLSEDLLKVICYHKRDGLGHEDVIGIACISVRELVRTFGTRVQVELLRKKSQKVAGSICFMGEALPHHSPRGSNTTFDFHVAAMTPRKNDGKYQFAKMFLVISRERDDKTWGIVYRSDVVKKLAIVNLTKSKHQIVFKPFQLRQAEFVLGMTPKRRIKFSFFQKGRRGEPHIRIGQVVTSAEELLQDFAEDTSLDFMLDDRVIGEFANVARTEEKNITKLNIELNYFDSEREAREIKERGKRKVMNLNSP
ncbi:unnamed protein product [Chondrus crispus]|uniref:C2 domain-containing protein n=1 Tax=Chondrus crispus TaxID=2769 RepID=R7Q8X4_CHOCR|nr:unnamed protein product [Chondrus crispus]CDF33925.1 unnamed protein product [Chondrus crispus]|eukprot:XP_005713744.1 unnamed protein product [Chondrus crispus]